MNALENTARKIGMLSWPNGRSSGKRITAAGLVRVAAQGAYFLAALVVATYTYYVVRAAFDHDQIGFDFRGTILEPAAAIVDGRSPYPAPRPAEVEVGNPALYPPLLMILAIPFTLLPWPAAVAVWTGLLAVALGSSLYLLGVRDPRCYVVALLTPITGTGLIFGNATLLLVPVVAFAWRWRDQWLRTGLLVGVAIASKLFLWPLFFWLLGTRRYRAFAASVGAAVGGLVLSWAVIGFDGLSSYPDLLRVAEDVYAAHSYSVATVLSALGVDTQIASRVTVLFGLTIALVAFYLGRRGDDGPSLTVGVLAAILGSPIVWPFYFALLLVPLAIARHRFSGWWAGLMLFYVANRLPRPSLSPGDFDPGGIACCRPDDVPFTVWAFNHSPSGLWPAVGYAFVATAMVAVLVRSMVRIRRVGRVG